MYGKATENAIAAMSRLAEVYDEGQTLLSASEIAENRELQKPFVSKLLSTLSQAGLVTGQRGPGGGFCLAFHPSEITLHEVWSLFEREDFSDKCPFGGGYCGSGDPCALHDKLVALKVLMDQTLRETTFEGFRVAYQEKGHRAAKRAKKGSNRKTYRASQSKR